MRAKFFNRTYDNVEHPNVIELPKGRSDFDRQYWGNTYNTSSWWDAYFTEENEDYQLYFDEATQSEVIKCTVIQSVNKVKSNGMP